MSESVDRDTLTVQVNGENQTFEGVATMSDLLRKLGIDPERGGVAVALNLNVLPKSEFAGTRLNSGDRVELVQAVQGG